MELKGGVIPTKKVVEKQRKQAEMMKRIKAQHKQQVDYEEELNMTDVLSMLSSVGFGPTLRSNKRDKKSVSVKVENTKEKKSTSKLVSKSSKSIKKPDTNASSKNKTKISKVVAKPMIKEIKERLMSIYNPEIVPYFKQQLLKYDGFIDKGLAEMNIVDFLMEKYAKDLIEPIIKKAIKGLTKGKVEGLYDDSTLISFSSFEINRPEERSIDKMIDDFKVKLDSNYKRNKKAGITQKDHTLSHKDVNELSDMLSAM